MQHKRNIMAAHRKAFTLVELLVVIGIIAVLISILLPALNKAVASARSVACQSNLRQTGLAFALYYNDNKQYIPPAYRSWHSAADTPDDPAKAGRSWDMYLATYLGKPRPTPNASGWLGAPGVLHCPSDDIPRASYAYGTAVRSYSMVLSYSTFLTMNFYSVGRADDAMFLFTYPTLNVDQYLIKITSVKSSASTLLLCEGWQASGGNVNIAGTRINSYMYQPAEILPLSPHPNKKLNFLYCDGHVESNTISEICKLPTAFNASIGGAWVLK